jgi:hypothetical protein
MQAEAVYFCAQGRRGFLVPIRQLNIVTGQLVSGAYPDLLAKI